MRFTTDPLDFRQGTEEIVSLLSVGGVHELMLYASGERRLGPDVVDPLPADWHERILGANAAELYGGGARVDRTRADTVGSSE
jgi:hypothetical protein